MASWSDSGTLPNPSSFILSGSLNSASFPTPTGTRAPARASAHISSRTPAAKALPFLTRGASTSRQPPAGSGGRRDHSCSTRTSLAQGCRGRQHLGRRATHRTSSIPAGESGDIAKSSSPAQALVYFSVHTDSRGCKALYARLDTNISPAKFRCGSHTRSR